MKCECGGGRVQHDPHYFVKDDTVSQICHKYKISMKAFLQMNPHVEDINKIYVSIWVD